MTQQNKPSNINLTKVDYRDLLKNEEVRIFALKIIETYQNRCVDPETSNRHIWFAEGQRSIAHHLQSILNAQE